VTDRHRLVEVTHQSTSLGTCAYREQKHLIRDASQHPTGDESNPGFQINSKKKERKKKKTSLSLRAPAKKSSSHLQGAPPSPCGAGLPSLVSFAGETRQGPFPAPFIPSGIASFHPLLTYLHTYDKTKGSKACRDHRRPCPCCFALLFPPHPHLCASLRRTHDTPSARSSTLAVRPCRSIIRSVSHIRVAIVPLIQSKQTHHHHSPSYDPIAMRAPPPRRE
jgi:hypothetical protein